MTYEMKQYQINSENTVGIVLDAEDMFLIQPRKRTGERLESEKINKTEILTKLGLPLTESYRYAIGDYMLEKLSKNYNLEGYIPIDEEIRQLEQEIGQK